MKVRIKRGKTAFVWNQSGGQFCREGDEVTLVEHDGITVEQQFSKIAMEDITPKVVKKAPVKKAVRKKAK